MDKWLGLEGKVVVVTGAVGGMGKTICEEFAKQNSKIVLLDLFKYKSDEYAKLILQSKIQ